MFFLLHLSHFDKALDLGWKYQSLCPSTMKNGDGYDKKEQ
jgi:hypothetical protein